MPHVVVYLTTGQGGLTTAQMLPAGTKKINAFSQLL